MILRITTCLLLTGLCLGGCHEDDTVPVTIEVFIDELGFVHIYAQNDEDLFYGAGYQMASDRMYQMEMLRRFAFGRMAEVLGEFALERDRQARMFDLPRWGRVDAEYMAQEFPEMDKLIRAWGRGINKRIEEVRSGEAPLPLGYGPDEFDFLPELWAEEDPYIVLKGANFALDRTIEFEVAVTLITEFFTEVLGYVQIMKPAFPVFTMPPGERPRAIKRSRTARAPRDQSGTDAAQAFKSLAQWLRAAPRPSGSNNWAIDGRFTFNSRPLIAGDPHLSFDFFGAPYPLHLNSKDQGGSFDVAGFAYPGTPGIALGHNDKIIWTATTARGDVNDIWTIERSGGGILIGDQVVGVRQRPEDIIVRSEGQPVGEGTVESITYEDVDNHGVLVPNELLPAPVGPYLMDWTGFKPREASWFLPLNRVTSLDEFDEVMSQKPEMNYYFVAADKDGISSQVACEVPDRPDVAGTRAPWMVMDSTDPGSLWTGQMLPRSKMPHSRAESRGWLVTANNDPFGFTEDGRIDNDPWYYGSLFAPGFRAKRITDEVERLTGRGNVTLDEMKILQMDTHSGMADLLIPLLSDAHANIDSDPALSEFAGNSDLDTVVQLLTVDWDRRMARDSAGAVAFQAFIHYAGRLTLEDDIALAYDIAMELQTVFVIKVAVLALAGQYPEGDMVLQEGRDWLLLKATESVVGWLNDHFGTVDPDSYQYSDVKVTNFDDAFGYGLPVFSTPTDGGEDTVCVSQNISFDPEASQWVSTYVSQERSVGFFAEGGIPEVHVNFPVGARSDPQSSRTLSANQDYVEGNYHKILFKRDEIEAAAVEQFEIQPE